MAQRRLTKKGILILEAVGRRLGLTADETWEMLEDEAPGFPNLDASFAEAFAPLTSKQDDDTLNTVNASSVSSNALRSRARFANEVREHRFVRAISKRGLTYADVAVDLTEKLGRKVPRSTVQSWAKPEGDPSYRAIQQDAADALKELYGVPLNAWRRIVPAP
jgi:hypothetical protein